MNRTRIFLVLLFSTVFLASCTHMPQLFWPANAGSGQQAGSADNSPVASRQPLTVPPDLRGQVSVPMPDRVASDETPAMQQAQAKEKRAVAGTAVALDTRVYDQDVATVFSSVVDAMTALNMPVQSVDSPSGTITTDWVHQGSNSASVFSGLLGAGPTYLRYRFVVRVLRLTTPTGVKAQLEVRTLAQVFENSHWVNKPMTEKVSNNLFSAVGEQLARHTQGQSPVPSAPATAPQQ